MYSAGKSLIKQLDHLGIENVYLVPGESYLAALDGLYASSIRVINTRHEGGASMMAQAEAKFTNKPGIAFVTRGPGATNASCGVHVAQQDSTPLILFIGQVARSMRGKDAFQEVDYQHFFGGMAKKVFEVNDPNTLPDIVVNAYEIAMADRKGPVVIALPEDMLGEACSATPMKIVDQPLQNPDFSEVLNDINKARQVSIILGGYNLSPAAKTQLETLSTEHSLAICCSFRRQDLFDNYHPHYFGELGLGVNPELVQYLKSSDLIIVLDDRLSEVPSQNYTLLNNPTSEQKVVHIYPDQSEFNRSFAPTSTIVANSSDFVSALSTLKKRQVKQDINTVRQSYLDWSTPTGSDLMSQFMRAVNEQAPANTIFTNGAGNYAIWLQRFRRFRNLNQYVASTCGSMGYGLPAAIAAKLNNPDTEVLCFAGDGCIQMTLQELATAHQYNLPIRVVVIDNGRYATIRMHQERHFPGHVVGTNIINPDFAQMAKSFGFNSVSISTEDEINDALNQCFSSDSPFLIHLKTDPNQLTPSLELDSDS